MFCVQGGYLRRLVTGVTPNDPTLDRTPNDLNIAGDFDPTRKECVAACLCLSSACVCDEMKRALLLLVLLCYCI